MPKRVLINGQVTHDFYRELVSLESKHPEEYWRYEAVKGWLAEKTASAYRMLKDAINLRVAPDPGAGWNVVVPPCFIWADWLVLHYQQEPEAYHYAGLLQKALMEHPHQTVKEWQELRARCTICHRCGATMIRGSDGEPVCVPCDVLEKVTS